MGKRNSIMPDQPTQFANAVQMSGGTMNSLPTANTEGDEIYSTMEGPGGQSGMNP